VDDDRPRLADALGIQRRNGSTDLSSWHGQAACIGQPLSVFFSEAGSRRDDGDTLAHDRAKRICSRCEVRRPCLEEAFTVETPIWNAGQGRWERPLPAVYGGATPEERWADDVRHLDDCISRKKCRGCRPIPERVDVLESRLRDQARRFLTTAERVA
jgi:hypothetical protein